MLSFMTMPSYFQGQTRHEARIPYILTMIVCNNSSSLLVIANSEVENGESQRGHPLQPFLCRGLAHTAMQAHFQGQTSLKVRITPVLR